MKYRIKCRTFADESQSWVVQRQHSFFIKFWVDEEVCTTFKMAENYVKAHTVLTETIINLKS